MNKRNRLSEQEIKKVELDALLYIRKICQQYHLRYYLAWGTLLGAVRHKGENWMSQSICLKYSIRKAVF